MVRVPSSPMEGTCRRRTKNEPAEHSSVAAQKGGINVAHPSCCAWDSRALPNIAKVPNVRSIHLYSYLWTLD